MKTPNSIQALLEALKNAESKGGLPGSDDDDMGKPIAAKLSVIKAKPLDGGSDAGSDSLPDDMSDMISSMGSDHQDGDQDEDQDSQDDQRDAQMVDLLQEQYPEIYAKLDKQMSSGDQEQDHSQADAGMPL